MRLSLCVCLFVLLLGSSVPEHVFGFRPERSSDVMFSVYALILASNCEVGDGWRRDGRCYLKHLYMSIYDWGEP